jgi:hypothetical protein
MSSQLVRYSCLVYTTFISKDLSLLLNSSSENIAEKQISFPIHYNNAHIGTLIIQYAPTSTIKFPELAFCTILYPDNHIRILFDEKDDDSIISRKISKFGENIIKFFHQAEIKYAHELEKKRLEEECAAKKLEIQKRMAKIFSKCSNKHYSDALKTKDEQFIGLASKWYNSDIEYNRKWIIKALDGRAHCIKQKEEMQIRIEQNALIQKEIEEKKRIRNEKETKTYSKREYNEIINRTTKNALKYAKSILDNIASDISSSKIRSCNIVYKITELEKEDELLLFKIKNKDFFKKELEDLVNTYGLKLFNENKVHSRYLRIKD